MVTESTKFKLQLNCRFRIAAISASMLLALLALASGTGAAQEVAPSKQHLIEALRALNGHLEKGDFVAGSKLVVMPPQLRPEDLESLRRLREISLAGIARLEKEAKFGRAADVFGEERATHFAEKMGADVSRCYGMNYQVGDVTAEVIGQWDKDHFLLVRIDDIGKLQISTGDPQPTNASPPKVWLPSFAQVRYPLAAPANAPNYQAIAAKIGALSQAVQANPTDHAARATYAKALFMIKNYPMAWQQLMAAYKIDPKHGGGQKGVDAMVDALTAQGVFGTNVPRETIEGLLGEPRSKVDMKGRDRYVYAQWAIEFENNRVRELIDLRGATNEWFQPQETVNVDLDGRGWSTGFRKKQNGIVMALLYVPGESVANCTEQIAVERIVNGAGVGSLKMAFEKMVTDQRQLYPKTQFKLLAEDENSLLIASTLPGTGEQNRHSLVKVMRGAKDLHRLTYTLLQKEPPSKETQMKWAGMFQKATLKNVRLNAKSSQSSQSVKNDSTTAQSTNSSSAQTGETADEGNDRKGKRP